MDEQKQIIYGILGCCLGIVVGFTIGFPIIFQLSYEKRGYIGVPFMLILVLASCSIGGIIGVKLAKRSDKDSAEYDR